MKKEDVFDTPFGKFQFNWHVVFGNTSGWLRTNGGVLWAAAALDGTVFCEIHPLFTNKEKEQ